MEREQPSVEKISKKEIAISGAIWTTISAGTILAMVSGLRADSPNVHPDDTYPEQAKNELVISPPEHLQAIWDEESSLSKLPLEEARTEKQTQPLAQKGKTKHSKRPNMVQSAGGLATYYGVTDGYGPEDPLGCTGESFNPYDPRIAARPLSSPFKCGDKVEVCDSDSCIEVVIQDTCPGCDQWGVVIDLSYGAMQKLTGEAGRAWVTVSGPK